MASGDQIKSLLNAYYNRDENRFKTVALQIVEGAPGTGKT